MVTPVAKFKSASSSEKILRLIFYGLSCERFLWILLKFDSIGYMPYLRQILTYSACSCELEKQKTPKIISRYFALTFSIQI